MECKGKLISAAKDWVSGKFRLTFEIEDDVSGQIDGIADKPLRIKAAQWREKRSLDSNAYYWVLLSKLAEDLHISKPRAHNIMLREYGQSGTGRRFQVLCPNPGHGRSRKRCHGKDRFSSSANITGGRGERRNQLPHLCCTDGFQPLRHCRDVASSGWSDI